MNIEDCEDCIDCSYAGEGDFYCMAFDYPVLVMVNWKETKYWGNCQKCERYTLSKK